MTAEIDDDDEGRKCYEDTDDGSGEEDWDDDGDLTMLQTYKTQ